MIDDDLKLVSSVTYQEKLDASDLEAFAPAIGGHYRKTSDPTIDYNCLAWAVENNQKWFDPQRFCIGYYWPKDIPRIWNMANVLMLLASYGYVENAENESFEAGYVKVAIYADSEGVPTHFARQVGPEKWTSKAGELIDFEHDNLECLICADYGRVDRILKKRI
jgi:hypothetical protein